MENAFKYLEKCALYCAESVCCYGALYCAEKYWKKRTYTPPHPWTLDEHLLKAFLPTILSLGVLGLSTMNRESFSTQSPSN